MLLPSFKSITKCQSSITKATYYYLIERLLPESLRFHQPCLVFQLSSFSYGTLTLNEHFVQCTTITISVSSKVHLRHSNPKFYLRYYFFKLTDMSLMSTCFVPALIISCMILSILCLTLRCSAVSS